MQKTLQTLYGYWNEVRAGRLAPQRLEIEPSQIAGILSETFMLERIDAATYQYRLAGTRLCEMFGSELRGKNFLEGWSEPDRHPEQWELATAYLGLVPLELDPHVPVDTRWFPVEQLPKNAFDHGAIVLAGRERLRGKLSYSNIGFALAPQTFTLAELRDVYEAVLGYDVSATNLKRVLLRRGAIEPTGERRSHGPGGGRPAAAFRFRTRRLEVTDPFAVLRPPTSGER